MRCTIFLFHFCTCAAITSCNIHKCCMKNLTFLKFEPTTPNMSQDVATRPNRVPKHTQHSVPNNVAICCVEMLGSSRWPNTVFARLYWCNSARAQGLQKTNMPSIERSFYLLTICAIFLYNWTQCIGGFSLLLQRYVRKGNDAKNRAILSFFFVIERTQLNAAHA